MTTIKFEIPEHDCKLKEDGYCIVEELYYRNISLLEKQPMQVPYKYHLQGDFVNFMRYLSPRKIRL